MMSKNVLIRNIDEETLEKLKKKASDKNHSLQEELKNLLEFHAGPDKEEAKRRMEKIRKELRNLKKPLTDSTEEIRKIREERINRLL